jgi:hypothetical protein
VIIILGRNTSLLFDDFKLNLNPIIPLNKIDIVNDLTRRQEQSFDLSFFSQLELVPELDLQRFNSICVLIDQEKSWSDPRDTLDTERCPYDSLIPSTELHLLSMTILLILHIIAP